MADDNDNGNGSDLDMLRRVLAVKTLKKVKRPRIPKGEIEKYSRVPFNDFIAVNRIFESVDADVVLSRLSDAESQDDLVSLMAVEYLIKNAPTDEIKGNIVNAVQKGSSINEITQYACKEFQKSVDDRKFEKLLLKFAESSRDSINREILSELRRSDVRDRLSKTTKPDDLAALYITSWLINKFKKTDPDLEKIMQQAISQEQDLKKVAEAAMLRYSQSVPEDAKKSAFENIQRFAYKSAEKDFYNQKKEELSTMGIYTFRGMFMRAVLLAGAVASLLGYGLFRYFSAEAEDYYAKFAHKLPAATAFESSLKKYLDERVVLELKEPFAPSALKASGEQETAAYQKILLMEELSGNPRRPDAELLSKKIDALAEFIKKYPGTQLTSAAAEKEMLLIYLNKDLVKKDIVPLLEDMLSSGGKVSQAIEWYAKAAPEKNPVAVINWLQAVKEKTTSPMLKAEIAYILASASSEDARAMLTDNSLSELCRQYANNGGSMLDGQTLVDLYRESMHDFATAARACSLIGRYFLGKADESEMIRWDNKAIEYYKKAGNVPQEFRKSIARAHLRLGKAYITTRYYQKGEELFDEAVKLDPDLAIIVNQMKDDAEAIMSREFWKSIAD